MSPASDSSIIGPRIALVRRLVTTDVNDTIVIVVSVVVGVLAIAVGCALTFLVVRILRVRNKQKDASLRSFMQAPPPSISALSGTTRKGSLLPSKNGKLRRTPNSSTTASAESTPPPRPQLQLFTPDREPHHYQLSSPTLPYSAPPRPHRSEPPPMRPPRPPGLYDDEPSTLQVPALTRKTSRMTTTTRRYSDPSVYSQESAAHSVYPTAMVMEPPTPMPQRAGVRSAVPWGGGDASPSRSATKSRGRLSLSPSRVRAMSDSTSVSTTVAFTHSPLLSAINEPPPQRPVPTSKVPPIPSRALRDPPVSAPLMAFPVMSRSLSEGSSFRADSAPNQPATEAVPTHPSAVSRAASSRTNRSYASSLSSFASSTFSLSTTRRFPLPPSLLARAGRADNDEVHLHMPLPSPPAAPTTPLTAPPPKRRSSSNPSPSSAAGSNFRRSTSQRMTPRQIAPLNITRRARHSHPRQIPESLQPARAPASSSRLMNPSLTAPLPFKPPKLPPRSPRRGTPTKSQSPPPFGSRG